MQFDASSTVVSSLKKAQGFLLSVKTCEDLILHKHAFYFTILSVWPRPANGFDKSHSLSRKEGINVPPFVQAALLNFN